MKKIFKIILSLIVILVGIIAFSVLTGRFDKGLELYVSGNSMSDYGFIGGSEEYILDSNHRIYTILEKCDIGEICSFVCQSNKCLTSEKDSRDAFKMLKDKKDDCYWFEGNADKNTSFDSRWYGWLCGDEIKITGVIK